MPGGGTAGAGLVAVGSELASRAAPQWGQNFPGLAADCARPHAGQALGTRESVTDGDQRAGGTPCPLRTLGPDRDEGTSSRDLQDPFLRIEPELALDEPAFKDEMRCRHRAAFDGD